MECKNWDIQNIDWLNVLKSKSNESDISKATDLIRFCSKKCENYDCVEECWEKLVEALLQNKNSINAK
jgi:hypothetical protein